MESFGTGLKRLKINTEKYNKTYALNLLTNMAGKCINLNSLRVTWSKRKFKSFKYWENITFGSKNHKQSLLILSAKSSWLLLMCFILFIVFVKIRKKLLPQVNVFWHWVRLTLKKESKRQVISFTWGWRLGYSKNFYLKSWMFCKIERKGIFS